MKPKQELHRGLEERHITLMSLGAAIGVGLFLGSASAIEMAGPAILLAYALGGSVMFIIMRALGRWRFISLLQGLLADMQKTILDHWLVI